MTEVALKPYASDDLHIDRRSGLPEEWQFLLKDHPKPTWMQSASLGEHGRFWLTVHRSFRMAGADLVSKAGAYEAGAVTAEQFRIAAAPRLQQFLGSLDHHHRIEDHLFFPRFVEAESRLADGIDLLEADHTVIDETVHRMVETANALLRTAATDGDGLKRHGEAFAIASRRIVALLDRHLDDEEDLVIPLILDRGEDQVMPM